MAYAAGPQTLLAFGVLPERILTGTVAHFLSDNGNQKDWFSANQNPEYSEGFSAHQMIVVVLLTVVQM
jgi:hypothetical protein